MIPAAPFNIPLAPPQSDGAAPPGAPSRAPPPVHLAAPPTAEALAAAARSAATLAAKLQAELLGSPPAAKKAKLADRSDLSWFEDNPRLHIGFLTKSGAITVHWERTQDGRVRPVTVRAIPLLCAGGRRDGQQAPA